MVRALAHRNYRLFFAGQGISLVGTWITRVATSWLVYRLTGSAAVLGYLPPGGLSDKPFATLLGRPVLAAEWCQALGTQGDILLADLRHYVTITKGMVESALSIHLRFDYDESTFRFIFRIDGQPWWTAALTPYKGSNTQSCFVTLATRA